MKTTIEVKGYTIVIEEMEEMVQVSAMMDEEVVEEFTLEPMEGEEDLKGFQDFEEEDDFEDDMEEDEMEEMEEDEMEEDEMEEDEMEEDEEMEGALESFQTFINKPKKRK